MTAFLLASIPSPGSKGFSILGLELRAYGLMIASVVLPRRFASLQPARGEGTAARESAS